MPSQSATTIRAAAAVTIRAGRAVRQYDTVGLLNSIPFRVSNLTLNSESTIHHAPGMAGILKEAKLHGKLHGLRIANEGINQRNLKIWADVADKICFGRN